ncbi:MAG: hypothetical protein JW929_08175 [Anaerolineales bacterium]|nr:hypothetical protein [Anaerolineales bacterium]
MSYKLSVSADGKYIIAKHWGDLTGDVLINRIQEAHRLGEKLGITKHLMDVTEARNVDPASKTYRFANQDIRNAPGISLKVTVAVLVDPEDHTHDFSETATRNAGQNVTIFTDREAAIRYLTEKS